MVGDFLDSDGREAMATHSHGTGTELSFPEYVSVWCALDDCSGKNIISIIYALVSNTIISAELNGTLAFPKETHVVEIDCDNIQASKKRKHASDKMSDETLSSLRPESRVDTSEWGIGIPVVVPAGTAVLFSSQTW
jgi:hypothetical protein